MKKAAAALAAIIVVLIAAALIVPGLIDWNKYKPEIVAAASENLGRDLAIKGDLSVNVLPAPALSIKGIELAGIKGAQSPYLAKVKQIDVAVSLSALLTGSIKVERVTIDEPQIVLERLKDGRANWDLQPAESAEASKPSDATASAGDIFDLSLDVVEIRNGSLEYLDHQSGLKEQIKKLNLVASAGSLQGPFKAKGDLVARGMRLIFDAAIGTMRADRPLSVGLDLKLPDAGSATISFKGAVSEPSANGTLKGKLRLASANLASTLSKAAGLQTPALLAQKIELASQVEASQSALRLSGLELAFGTSRGRGKVDVVLGEKTKFDVELKIKNFDADKLMSLAAARPAKGKAKSAAQPTPKATKGGFSLPAIPPDLEGKIAVTIDGITYKGALVRQTQVALNIANGRLAIKRMSALLPGGSDVSLSGELGEKSGAPSFEGSFEFASNNLRSLMKWLGFAVNAPADRFASLVSTARLRAREGRIEIANINTRFDSTTLTGSLTADLSAKPSFRADVEVDRINLDGYLAAFSPGGGGKGEAAQPAAGANSASGVRDPAALLAVLDDFDAQAKVTIKRLSYNRSTLSNFVLVAGVKNGNASLSKMSVLDSAKGKLSVKAALTRSKKRPAILLSVSYKTESLAGLARLLDLKLPLPPEKIRRFSGRISASGWLNKIKLKSQLAAMGGKIVLNGSVTKPLSDPRADMTFEVSHRSLRSLSRQFALGLKIPKKSDGPVRIGGDVRGGLAQISVDVTASVAGAQVKLVGGLRDVATTPSYNFAVNAKHDDIHGLLRGLGVTYRMPKKTRGGLLAFGSVKGNASVVMVQDLNGTLVNVKFDGNLTLKNNPERPHVRAKLNFGSVVLDDFISDQPAVKKTAKAKNKKGARRWSRQAIDLSALSSIDADVDIKLRSVNYGKIPIKNPVLVLALKDGVLAINKLAAQTFKGTFDATGRVSSGDQNSLAVAFKLDGARLKPALQSIAGIEQISGLASANGKLNASGRSEWDLVRSLNGNFSLDARDGEIQGIDIPRLAGVVNNPFNLVNLLSAFGGDSKTKFVKLTGDWTVKNGIARTENTRADFKAAFLSMSGDVRLPPWNLKLNNAITITDQDNLPPVKVLLTGPIDAPDYEVDSGGLASQLGGGKAAIAKNPVKAIEETGKALDKTLKSLFK